MKIRIAKKEDTKLILKYDKHISESELYSSISLGRVIIAEYDNKFIGWLRWNLFWENLMKQNNYKFLMTSTLSNENAQHFYRKLNYIDSGSLLLKGEALEIIFTKEL